MAEGDLVDKLVTYPLCAHTMVWRTYFDVYGPLAAHPQPEGRMALVQDVPARNAGRGGLFLASRVGGAIWEVLLRDLQPRNGIIALPQSALAGRSLVQLRVREDVQLVDLSLPARRNLFINRNAASLHRINTFWNLILASPDHTQSHHAAAELAALATQLGIQLNGFTWLSAQDQSAKVHLLYEPPYAATWLEVVDNPIPLTSADGIRAVRRAAKDAHMTLMLTGDTPHPCEEDDA